MNLIFKLKKLLNLRKVKGLSQEELAIKLNVVRQTISKWKNGQSVPDSSMLILLAEELDTSVSNLLGEIDTISNSKETNIESIAEKLEIINLQFAKSRKMKLHKIRCLLIGLIIFIMLAFLAFLVIDGEYLIVNFKNPELAIVETLLHGFEFIFVRISLFILIGSIIGVGLTYYKK